MNECSWSRTIASLEKVNIRKEITKIIFMFFITLFYDETIIDLMMIMMVIMILIITTTNRNATKLLLFNPELNNELTSYSLRAQCTN